jgi:hypothetical protein
MPNGRWRNDRHCLRSEGDFGEVEYAVGCAWLSGEGIRKTSSVTGQGWETRRSWDDADDWHW